MLDDSLVPWTSPGGTPMQIAAAAPNIPWTDLAYSLAPNGSTLDYVADAPYEGRVGVMKESLVNGLYLSGLGAPGFYAPVGTDPTADLTGWRDAARRRRALRRRRAGDRSTRSPTHHSSYYIDDSIAAGADADVERLHGRPVPGRRGDPLLQPHPDQSPEGRHLALFFGDFGHPRAQNKDDVIDAARGSPERLDGLLRQAARARSRPRVSTAYTQTCPLSAASGGPYTAQSWAKMAKGEIRVRASAELTIDPDAGSSERRHLRPGLRRRRLRDRRRRRQPGTASYRLDPAPEGGYTLMGSPTVIANFTLPGDTSQVAARLLDVAPDGQETLVARGPLASGDRWADQAGVPAAPERLAVRRGSRAEARAACQRLRRPGPSAATGAPPTTSSRSRSRS